MLPITAAAFLCSALLHAQQWSAAVPTTAKPPVLDGVLAPGEWSGAVVISDFKQIEPQEGAPSEKTEVFLMCDADNLYIAVMCHDRTPEKILANIMARDAVIDADDHIELVIDTFLDRRNAYFFQIGPGGSIGDGLVGNNGSVFIKDWDGIWDGRARTVEGGWSAEMAIPAKTLSMGSTHESFGFNIIRTIKHSDEVDQWANPRRDSSLFSIAEAGTISGLRVLTQGLGLDVKPYALARYRRDVPKDEGLTAEMGFDARWRVTSELTAVVTVNTDFAETEVDERIVNLTRFPVFFREKRGFFLEDSSIFAFGGLGSAIVPFFSRRIGLSATGERVPILAGLKATGRFDGLNFGLLDVVTDSFEGVDARNLAVGRVALNVLEESQVGAIFTSGDPATNGGNTLAGLDFTYRTHRAFGDKNFRLSGFLLGTDDSPESPGEGGSLGYAYGFTASYPNDEIEAELAYREVSSDFQPDLGFVSRVGERRIFGDFEWRPRIGGGIRRFAFGVAPDVFLSLDDGEVNSFSAGVKLLEVELDSEDGFALLVTPTVERLTEPFEIEDGVVLDPGNYSFTRFAVEFSTADKRMLSCSGRYEFGSFYTGTLESFEIDGAIRPSPGLTIGLAGEHSVVRLREGAFEANVARLRVKIDFSPTLSWNTFAQWDDDSGSIGVNSRVRWIVEPGSEVFFVVNQGFETRDPITDRPNFRAAGSEVTIKVGYTFRF